MSHPARELWHAFRLTFQATKGLFSRVLPTRKPREPKTNPIAIQSPALSSMEQGQAWAMVAPDIWFVKRWERGTRRQCWFQMSGALVQLAMPFVFHGGHIIGNVINATLAGFLITAQDRRVREFATVRATLLKALEEHTQTEPRWYDESKLLSRREARR